MMLQNNPRSFAQTKNIFHSVFSTKKSSYSKTFINKIILLLGVTICLLYPNPTNTLLANAGPKITHITDNTQAYPNGHIPQYSKYELTFQVETVATNPYFPYDPAPPPGIAPGIGVTVKGLFSPDRWQTVYTQPGFYYQEFLSETREDRPWYYPTGEFAWKVRFAPPSPGEWEYKIVVQDATGSAESTTGTFTVIPTDNPGFIRVSQRDPRYFEFDNGSLFLGQGYQMVLRENRPEFFEVLRDNGIQLGRVWLAPYSIFGSAWNPLYESRNNYGGYIPRTGMIAFKDDVTGQESIKLRIDWRDGNSGWFDACRVLGYWGTPIEVKPNTRYRIQVTYRGFNITGPRLPNQHEYGFVVKTNLGTPKCYDPGGLVLTTYGKNTPGQWGTIEGIWDSGNRNFLPHFWFVLENATNGEVYIDTISIQEELGDGQYGPNIVHKPSTQHHLYFQQHNSFVLDRRIEMAEQYGLYLKLVILEKGEDIFRKIAADGSFVDDQDNLFYGVGRQLTATRWLQQAWWRYLQARWGYSTSIHSWELINEGNPALENHYALADEFGKYMHCRVFDVPVADGDGQKCLYDHPNDHMVTTSFWHSFPAQAFWGNPKYPNVDYADVHAYVSTGWLQDPNHEVDAAAYHVDYSRSVRQNLDYAVGPNPTKPIVRGEAGIDFVNQQKEQPDLAQDTEGVWLHNFVWSGVDAGGLMELYWWGHNRETQPGPDGKPGLHEIYGAFFRFMKDVPLNNGYYEDVNPISSSSNIRVWGQIDRTNGRAHLWIQNRHHTWRNVVDGTLIPPESGTVTLTGFKPEASYLVEWWDTYAGTPTNTETVIADVSGRIQLKIVQLEKDVAVKIYPTTDTSTAVLKLTAATQELVPGQNIEVELQALGQQMDGAAAYLKFDPLKIHVQEIRLGTDLPIVLQNRFDNSTGTIEVAVGSLDGSISGTITLTTITFQALTSGKTTISFAKTPPYLSDITRAGESILKNTIDLTLDIAPKALVQGKIHLEGRPSPPHPQWKNLLAIALYSEDKSTPMNTFSVTSQEDGTFVLPPITPGTYQLLIRNMHSLRNVVPIKVEPGVHTVDAGVLREGDITGDNTVDILDFSVFSTYFGQCRDEALVADLNTDGCVSIEDFSLLSSNFGKQGDSIGNQGASKQQVLVGHIKDRKAGEKFSIPVHFVGSHASLSIDGSAFYFLFDPSEIRVLDVAPTQILGIELLRSINPQSGEVAYAAGTLKGEAAPPFKFITLEVEALKDVEQTPIILVVEPPYRSGVTSRGTLLRFDADYRGGRIEIHVDLNKRIFLPLISQ